MPNFDTGPTLLADVGKLEYNGCVFSPLFETNVSGVVVKDAAGRTTKFMEYTLTADGYATVSDTALDLTPTMATLRRLLTQHGAKLTYSGRGLDLLINGGPQSMDAAWGPVPKLMEFQPLGGGLSAKVRWQVVVHVPEVTRPSVLRDRYGRVVGSQAPLLQFNYDTTLTYGEDGYSSLAIRGTMEIPMTRFPSQTTRTLTRTVDDFRQEIETRLLGGIDLAKFRLARREFSVSRDKREMNFDVVVEEKPYMDLPPFCTLARGSFNVRPARTGAGLVSWHCTLKGTYTVRADVGRRAAWIVFLYLLRVRMTQAERAIIQGPAAAAPAPNRLAPVAALLPVLSAPAAILGALIGRRVAAAPNASVSANKALLIDFSFDEGLYLDSKTTSFSATWRLTSELRDILLASGLWVKTQEAGVVGAGTSSAIGQPGRNLWATTMAMPSLVAPRGVNGVDSWEANRLDPAYDVIVDFGS